jgi:hypothetical protein
VAIHVLDGLFGGGSILVMQRHLGAGRPVTFGALRSATCVAAVGWAPLLVLTAAQSRFPPLAGLDAFLADPGIHSRTLLAGPALALGRAVAYPQLSRMCAHFTQAGLITALDRPRFDAALATTRRLEASRAAALGALAIAYLLVVSVISTDPAMPEWHAGAADGLRHYSPAGWWHVMVTLPMLLMLLLGWLWRLLLWARLLWIVARYNLQLVPAHPDRAGGLKFVGYAVRSFAPAGFALGVIVAGALANRLTRQALPLTVYRDTAVGLLAFVVATFAAPLLVFIRPLSAAWQRGIHQYGSLAHVLGQSFERRWLRGPRPADAALERPDFSTINDLNQYVANVYTMRIVPVDVQSLLVLGVATTLPIGVVAVSTLPVEVLGQFIVDLMF